MNGDEIGFHDIGWPISTDDTPLSIGAGINEDDITEFSDGFIDEVRLYDRALTADQMKVLAGITWGARITGRQRW